jgi:hypothetical protein
MNEQNRERSEGGMVPMDSGSSDGDVSIPSEATSLFGILPPAPKDFEDMVVSAQTWRMRVSDAETDELNLRRRLNERQKLLSALEAKSYQAASGFEIVVEVIELKHRFEASLAVRDELKRETSMLESRIVAMGGVLPAEPAASEPYGRGRVETLPAHLQD